MNEQTRALYEAHVAHELARARQLAEQDFTSLSEHLFEWLSTVKLSELLTREQVLGVIDRYVIELRISGGIAELVGQLAQAIFTSEAGAAATLEDLLSYQSYRDFADKIQSLDAAIASLLRLITRARSFPPLLARTLMLTARSLWLASKADSSLQRFGRVFDQKIAPELAERLQRYFEKHAEPIARANEAHLRTLLDPDALRSLADDLWDAVARMRVSELFGMLSSSDMEDFVVLGYEAWLRYRHTPYFRAACEQGVDVFFTKYGAESAQLFLDDMGVTPAMVAHELGVLVSPVLARALQDGSVERTIRARLEPFYRSQAAQSILAR